MAAKNSSSTGKKNFYNVAYGKLATRVKEVTDDMSEIKENELKSLTQNVENVDLRNKFLMKTGDYPYTIYYDSIQGQIQSIVKDEYDKGTSLHVVLVDTDGDESIIQIKFYSKYTENLLNRLANIQDVDTSILFTPYAIPSEFEIEGRKIKMYNQGVSLREDGVKVEVRYKNDDSDLPATQQVENSEGKMQTSRVKRINFLFDVVSKKFNNGERPATETSAKPATEKKPTTSSAKEDNVDDDDLPF